jgi:hypothetical protein
VRKTEERLAMVITRTGARGGPPDMPWLEDAYRVDASDWIVLSDEGWRAAADGEAAIWDALERKLLIGFYVTQPSLIAVVGHPRRPGGEAPEADGRGDVSRIVSRVRSLLLPAAVLGFWTDEGGWLEDLVESQEPGEVGARGPGTGRGL